jgi:hypothetical protein
MLNTPSSYLKRTRMRRRRCEQLRAIVREAREAEQAAKRAWHEARQRAEAKIKEEEAEAKRR